MIMLTKDKLADLVKRLYDIPERWGGRANELEALHKEAATVLTQLTASLTQDKHAVPAEAIEAAMQVLAQWYDVGRPAQLKARTQLALEAALPALSAVTALQRVAPPGWQLAPKEATKEMREAAVEAFNLGECWRLMLAAAPIFADEQDSGGTIALAGAGDIKSARRAGPQSSLPALQPQDERAERREQIARAIWDVNSRWLKTDLGHVGLQPRPFNEADERERRLHFEYADAALSAVTALQRGPDGWQTEVLTIASDMEAVADTVSPRNGTKHPAPYMREQARKLRALLADKRGES